jgi:hypothetical protein
MLCNLQNHNAATIGDLMFWKDGAVPSSWCSRNAIKPCLCTTLVRRAFMQEQTSMKNKYAWHLLAWLGTLLRIQSSEHYIASERINSCRPTSRQGHHPGSMGSRLAKSTKEGPVRNIEQNPPIPQPHDTLYRAPKSTGGVRPPNTMPHWPRIHGRIPQTVLPREERCMRMRGNPTNPRAHPQNMHTLHKPPGEPTEWR